MVVLEKRQRITRTDIKSFVKPSKEYKEESEESEEEFEEDDSDYEGGDETESQDDSDYEDNFDEESEDEENNGDSKKKTSTSNSKSSNNKKSSTKKAVSSDEESNDDDFVLPKQKKSISQINKEKRDKELKESKEIYEQTLKQASLDSWIVKKSDGANGDKPNDPTKFFSFANRKPISPLTNTATSTSNGANGTTASAPIRLASIKKTSFGGGGLSDKKDFFSNYLYKGHKAKEEPIKILDDDDDDDGDNSDSGEKVKKEKITKVKDQEDEEDEDSSTTMKNIKKQVQKMIKTTAPLTLSLEADEEEQEEPLLVNKKRNNSSIMSPTKKTTTTETTTTSKKQDIIEIDDDSSTEDESKPNKSTKKVEIDGEEEKQPKHKQQQEEEEEEEEEGSDVESEPTIEKLIYACEAFSKRMLEVLSNSDLEDTNKQPSTITTTTTTTTTPTSPSTIKKNKLIKQPKFINKTMRNYQLIGLNWLAVLYKEHINGILADEMGLGKTVQSISLLAHIMETYGDCGPHLIIVPATVMSNWERELTTWCPKLKIILYYGNIKERESLRIQIRKMKPKKDFNIILTTYNLLFSNLDRAFLKKFEYSYLILDEAQNIKNSDSRRYKNIFKIQSKHRLLLTGTPLQNNLYELWSLLNFLMPHIFGNTSKNNLLLNQLLEYKGDDSDSAISRMKKILSPFILRRLKSTVSKELKPKKEIVERCQMDQFQKNTYNTIIQRSKVQWDNREAAKETGVDNKKRKKKTSTRLLDPDVDLLDLTISDDDNGNETKKEKEIKKQIKQGGGVLNNILMQLRKAANHPLLCKNIFYTEDQMHDIATTLAKRDEEWIEFRTDVPALKELLMTYSDFEVFKAICENPYLADKYWIDDEQFYETSTKCQRLKEILNKEIHENKSKVLIFSQMTRMLDILEDVLSIFDFNFCRLDGQTPVGERQNIIDHFTNTQDIPVFLLSTNAGGLGINLTCANVVIFYDLSFNPQVDRQAEDRAHRLGQEREVIVYKLLTEGTVDIEIFNNANEKKKLNDNVLEEGTYTEKETKLESKKILKILDSIFY